MTYQEACKILDIQPNANIDEIKKAYKQKVKKYHPDIYQGDKKFAEDKIKKINEAYSILSKPSSNSYNTNAKQSTNTKHTTSTEFEDEFIRMTKEWLNRMIEEEIKQNKKMIKAAKILIFFIISTTLFGIGLLIYISTKLFTTMLVPIIIAVITCIIFLLFSKK